MSTRPTAVRPSWPWWARAWDAVSLYLPVVLMAALALLTWAIVQRPADAPASPNRALTAGEADTIVHGFTLWRHDAQGRLVARLRGQTLLHFPAEGLTEVHQAQLEQTRAETGWRHAAQAARLRVDDARRHHTFEGDARYERTPLPGRPGTRLSLQGQRFTWDSEAGLLESDTPVRWMRDQDVLTASRMRYDERLGLADFTGQVRATLAARPTR